MRTTSLYIIAVLFLFDTETVLTFVRQVRWALNWLTVLMGSTASTIFTQLESSWAAFNDEAVKMRLVALPVRASDWLS
jgi:hypothetical protein